jgi:hypothetical protein
MPSGETASPQNMAAPRKRKMLYWFAAIAVLGVIAGVAAGPILSQVEQPEYQIVETEGPFEIRGYGALIAAEAEIKGERQPAIEEGFRLIASYIFGNNAPKAKIDMTAPVQQQSAQKISMTAPVTQQGAGDVWKVRFIMPKSWTMETLPAPNDQRVELVPILPKRFAAIRFSGTSDDALIEEKTAALRRFVEGRKLATTGEPLLAFYNPPWTLPMLRRNEIMLELAN